MNPDVPLFQQQMVQEVSPHTHTLCTTNIRYPRLHSQSILDLALYSHSLLDLAMYSQILLCILRVS